MPPKKSKTAGSKKVSKDTNETTVADNEVTPVAVAMPLVLLENPSAPEESPLSSVFEVTPTKIVFLQFETNATYETKLLFKNRTKENQFLRVAQPTSAYFRVSAPKGSETTLKVAPGLTVSFKVVFSPTEATNCETELNVKSESDEFKIPVIAFPKRATLELPSRLELDHCPVKLTTDKSLFLKNTDDTPCIWRALVMEGEMASLCTLSPSFGTVPPSGGVQPVRVTVTPSQLRYYSGTIRFFLGPEGDLVQDLPLTCTTVELSVSLDTSTLRFDETYVTTEQRREVVLRNTSDERLDFCWRSSYQSDEEGAVLPFDDEVYSIEPVKGEIYGRGEKHFTVTFCPQLAIQSEAVAYLHLSGKLNPLPLKLSGHGVGPQCELEFDRLNIKDVYMNALHEYEVELSNVGGIEARFTVLESESLMGQKFTFTPSTGTLQPGETIVLKIELKSDLIGVLNEIFRIHLHGSLDELTLQFKGRIVGPSFQFDVDELDFGNVSYNFWHQRPFNISNTGQVPMNYTLRLAPEGGHVEEFIITPSKGVIPPMQSEAIVLEYLSNTAGELETALLVDIDDVGEAVDSIPVKAACMVAPLTLTQSRLGYGSCFIGYEYTLNVEVVNDTALSGKFELKVIDTKGIANVVEVVIGEPDQESPILILGPHSKQQVPVTLKLLAVGETSFSLVLHVLGDTSSPQTILINAIGCGPNVEVRPNILNFGDVNVLETVEKTLTLHNTSPIEAKFTVVYAKMKEKMESLKSKSKYSWEFESIFRVEPEEAVIEPFGIMTVHVFATADDAMTFTENLIFDIRYAEGSVEPVSLKAIGKGFPLRTDDEENASDIDLGDVFTDTPVSREVVIHNKGRKEQEVQWQNVRGAKVKEGAPPIVFAYRPERAIIKPRESFTFVVEGKVDQVGTFSDEFTLKQTGTFKEVMRCRVKAKFTEPLLVCSTRHIQFEYIQNVEVEGSGVEKHPNITMQSFTVKNTTPKDLEVVLKILKNKSKSPFSFEGNSRFSIATGETQVIGVCFDPNYLGDCVSHFVKNQIQISFTNHSRTENINVSAKISFPFLTIEPEKDVIDFGTIVKDTESSQELLLTNPSPSIPAVFRWEMVEDKETKVSAAEQRKRFDFTPFDGVIPPGESQRVVATFYGTAGKYEAKTRCSLQGGPSYTIGLKGSAGDVNILYDRTLLDFGVLQFYSQATQTIVISNPSHVAVNFVVDTAAVKAPGRISVSPMSGKITEKAEIKVTFCPLVPDLVQESFYIQVGHFDPQRIDVVGCGLMNSLAVAGRDETATVTRVNDSVFLEKLHKLMTEHEKNGTAISLYASKICDDVPSQISHHVDPLVSEAERTAFCSSLLKGRRAPPEQEEDRGTPVPLGSRKGGKTSSKRPSPERQPQSMEEEEETMELQRRVMRRNSTSVEGTSKYVLSKYVVDFGHMTRNDIKTTKLSLINTSAESLFLMIDSKEISRLPLTVNPLKITQLPPLSEAEVSITLDARPPTEEQDNNVVVAKRKTVSPENTPIGIQFGDNRFEFAIDVKGGPVIVVEVHCFVATPSLSLGTSCLDFGEVLLGQVKVLPLTLTNEQTVSCEWRLTWPKKGKEGGKSKSIRGIPSGYPPAEKKEEEAPEDKLDGIFPFWVNKERGVLEPCRSTTVEVFFSPIKAQQYSPTLRFKFVNNSKSQDILCTGGTRLYKVSINPQPKLSFPVVRPFQVAHEVITLTNEEEEPVEVFNYNLDPTFAEELSIFQRALSDEKNLFYPPRNAGDFLPDELLDRVFQKIAGLESPLFYVPPKHLLSRLDASPETAPADSRKPSASKNKRTSKASTENSVVPPVEVKPDVAPPTFLLFIGAPRSGKTFFASTLANLDEFETVEWEKLVESVARSDSVEGEILRNALTVLQTSKPKDEVEKGPKLVLPNAKEDPFLTPELIEALGPIRVEEDPNGVSSAHPNPFTPLPINPALLPEVNGERDTVDRDGRTSRAGSRSGSRSGRNTSFHSSSSLHAGGDESTMNTMDPKLILKVLQNKLQSFLEEKIKKHGEAKPLTGFVMDDLFCPVVYNRLELLKIVRQVCEAVKCPLKVINLCVSEATVGLRHAQQEQKLWKKKVDDAHVDPLDEDVYAGMSDTEREVYNLRLKYYSDCKREMQRAAKAVKEFEEALSNNAELLSVQAEIERQRESATSGEEIKGGKKGNKNAVDTTVEMKLKSGPISPLEAFKEFYEMFLTFMEQETSGAPPPSRAQAGPATLSSPLCSVPNESSVDDALQTILSSALQAEGLVTLMERSPGGTPTARSSGNRPVKFTDQSSSRDVSMIQEESRVGTWTYLDTTRLQFLKVNELKFVRFFSEVMKEATAPVKGKAPPKQAPKTTTSVNSISELTRWVIPAKSSISVTVEFCCDRDGAHISESLFGIVGTMQSIPLEIIAHAALPDIARDERLIFPHIRPRLMAGKNPAKAFMMAKRLYDFGALLVPLPPNAKRRKSKDERSTSVVSFTTGSKETLTFSNPGVSDAEMTLIFQKEKDNVFTASPARFLLAAGQTQTVELEANPTEVGDFSNVLVAVVKDNPEPWYVNVRCTGTRPAITFDGGAKSFEVDLGRTVVNRPVEQVFTLFNTSSLPVKWELSGLDKLPEEFRLSEVSGVIEELGVQPITVQFYPTTTCLHNISLQVQVASAAPPNPVYESLPLTLKAEGHDVVLEWTKEINYGLVHVGEVKTESIKVMNKSPYDVAYQIRIPKRLQSIVTVSPQVGTIRGLMGYKEAAIANIEVTVTFDREGELPKRVSVLEVAFLHPEARELLYPLQLIPVIGEAWYTKFAVKPSSGVDFGSCFFNQKKQRTFEIQNTGRFPVAFHLFNYLLGHQSVTEGNLALTTDNSAVKKGKTKNAESEIQVGCFTVYPCRAIIPVGESMTITVDALLPDNKTSNRETLGIYVEQSASMEQNNGVPLELAAHPATPGIAADLSNAADVESIFEEQQVVYRLDQFDKGTRAYGKEDRTFSYGSVLVGQGEEERFRISNTSPLPTSVTVQLLSSSTGNTTKGGKQTQPAVEGFELVHEGGDVPSSAKEAKETPNTVKLVLPPFESKFVTIRFTPTSLQRYTGHFTAFVENGADTKTNTLSFQIVGEGTLPNVEYVIPPRLDREGEAAVAEVDARDTSPSNTTKSKGKKKSTSHTTAVDTVQLENNTIDLPLTLVGETSRRSFTIRNTGSIVAYIRMAVLSDEEECKGLSISHQNEDVIILPGSEEVFDVSFSPSEAGKFSMRLYSTLLHNPFVDRELLVSAESFTQPISFEDIDPSLADHFNIGYCYVGEKSTHTFRIRNNTDHDVRYEWKDEDTAKYSVEWVPRVGHLGSGKTKTISLTVCSKETSPQRVTLEGKAVIQSIELPEEAVWDSSIVDQKWVVVTETDQQRSYGAGGRRNLRKVMEPVAEPHHVVTNHLSLAQVLRVSYRCDVPSYTLGMVDTEEGAPLLTKLDQIIFPTTKLFQRRIVTLRLSNTGRVALPYKMEIQNIASGAAPASKEEGEETNDAVPSGDFSIEPENSGSVEVGETKDIRVVFSPCVAGEANPRLLLCEFPYSAQPTRQMNLMGTGECPLIHIQVPPSEYLSLRVDGEAGPSVDPECSVLEFATSGLHSQCVQRFQVLNPTDSSYPFEWNEAASVSLSPFRCLTPSGVIAAGRTVEMVFEFIGETLGIRERMWSLVIPGKDASIPFLLVGKTVDPRVFLSGSKVHFGNVNLGGRAEKVVWMENRDDIPFNFTFNKAELKIMSPFLSVRPASGTIGPKEKLPITIVFTPQDEMEYNIPLSCSVKKASIPLTINVKGAGVSVHDSLVMEPYSGHPNAVPVMKDNLLVINLGRVQIDERVTRTFTLSNTGQSPFDYVVSLPERRFVSIENGSGHILPKERSAITLVYHPTSEESLKQFRLQFRIGGKITYQIGVQATTYVPKLQLNFTKYDFGPRFIQSANPMGGEISTTLTLYNQDKEEVTVECSLSENNNWCELDQTSLVVQPNGRREIKITFHPNEVRLYTDQLKLLLNGSYPMLVPLSGEGVQPRVEVTKQFAKFGSARVGEKRDVEVRLDCKSRIPTPVSFMGCLTTELMEKGVSIPSTPLSFVMKPKENRTVTLSFRPMQRMGEFQREMKMLVCGREYPFAMLSGSCQDAETQVDTTVVQFNDIVIGATATKRVMVMNSGDLPQNFSWSGIPSNGEISVNPPSGFMRAHTEISCEFVYRPLSPTSSINRTIVLVLERAPPISLQLEANAINRPPAKDTVRFRCRARQVDTKKIVVENTSSEPWTFTPVIDNALWTAPHQITLKPKSKGEVEVQYAPMRTTKGSGDRGSLFIPQDNGKGLTFALEGISDEAGPSAPLRELDITTRETHTVDFNVSNWSASPTRFTRLLEWTSPTNVDEGLVTVKGPATLDVPAGATADCAITLNFVREGQYRGVVRFHCTSNNDLNQYFELLVRVTSAAPSSASVALAEIHSVVRHRTQYNIPVGNPLMKPITVTCKLDGPPESVAALSIPSSITVPSKNAVNVVVEFMPLIHREYAPVKAILSCPDVDLSVYSLKLISSPPLAERLTRLDCPLGRSTSFSLRFTHYAKGNAEYSIKIGGEASAAPNANPKNAPPPIFTRAAHQPPTIKVTTTNPHNEQEITADFIYEPMALGNTKESIEIVSTTGGVYTFPILAFCVAPEPQGPYSLKAGQSASIPFKNVFSDTVAVQIQTDSPLFVVAKKTENVAAKKTITISVQCKIDNNANPSEVFFSKLFVSCVPPGETKPVEWIYYLEGTKEGKKK